VDRDPKTKEVFVPKESSRGEEYNGIPPVRAKIGNYPKNSNFNSSTTR